MRNIVVAYLLVLLILAVGWVLNLVAFFRCDFNAPYKAEIVRGIGIVAAPVGGVAGYIDIDD